MNRTRLFLTLCVSVMCAVLLPAHAAGDGQEGCGTLVFDSLSLDMGRIERDSAAVAVFHFRVAGNAPVLIQRAAVACNCTSVTYPETPVRPGEEGRIVVRYDSRGMHPGYFRKVIVVRSNASASLMKLSVSGVVRREKRIREVP